MKTKKLNEIKKSDFTLFSQNRKYSYKNHIITISYNNTSNRYEWDIEDVRLGGIEKTISNMIYNIKENIYAYC